MQQQRFFQALFVAAFSAHADAVAVLPLCQHGR
jgi:hypothetical protein